MNSYCICWLIIVFIVIVHIKANRYNISNTDLQYCKEYDVPGENYSALFLIDSFKLAKNTKVDNGETAINLRLYLLTLQGAQDARILLSPKDRSSAYEIVFGAQGNTHIAKHTAVKPNAQETALKSVAYDNIIYSPDITPLTLRITKSGNISVAITGQPPFISYYDRDLLPVKYISFSSKVKWFYDCESPASAGFAPIAPPDEDDKLEPINQNLERLQNDLFEQYDANIAPNDLKSFTIELTQPKFIPSKSVLTAHGKFRADWIDKQLLWNPSEYADTYQFQLKNTTNEQIWTPKIRVVNEMNGELTVLPLMYTVTVASTGQLFAESNDSLISTLCLHNNWNWAVETVNCNINIELDEVNVIQLGPLHSDFMEPGKPTIDTSNNWHVSSAYVSSNLRNTRIPNEDNESVSLKKATILAVNIMLREKNSLVHQFLSLPVVGNSIAICLAALSFRQKQTTAMIFNLCSLVLLFIMLLSFSFRNGPISYSFVICYTHTQFLAWSIILTAAIRWVGKESKMYI